MTYNLIIRIGNGFDRVDFSPTYSGASSYLSKKFFAPSEKNDKNIHERGEAFLRDVFLAAGDRPFLRKVEKKSNKGEKYYLDAGIIRRMCELKKVTLHDGNPEDELAQYKLSDSTIKDLSA